MYYVVRAMRPLALIAVAFAALALPAKSSAALFLLFDRAEAVPNERVTIRGVGVVTPIGVYLAPRAAIRSRFDPRLAFVGVLRQGALPNTDLHDPVKVLEALETESANEPAPPAPGSSPAGRPGAAAVTSASPRSSPR